MSFVCSSLVLFTVINAALCCTQERKEELLLALTSKCDWTNEFYVIYNGSSLACGELQSYDSVIQPPAVSFGLAQKGENYTLLMMTADAPGLSLYNLTFFLNWAVTGIKAADLMFDSKPTKNIVFEYYMSGSQTCESVRYKFVLLREDHGTPSLNPVDPRRGFDLKQFLNSNNMCDSLVAVFEIRVSEFV